MDTGKRSPTHRERINTTARAFTARACFNVNKFISLQSQTTETKPTKPMDYFKNCNTLFEIKDQFRKLAKEHHPDRGGDTAIMQEINNQYERAILSVKIDDKKESTAEWMKDQEINSNYREVIQATANLDGVITELIGLWLWFSGNTKPHKETFKENNCRWHRKKKMWYWRPEGLKHRKKSKKEMSIDEIRNKYGSTFINEEEDRQPQLYAN